MGEYAATSESWTSHAARAVRHSELLRSFLLIFAAVIALKACVIDQYTVPSSSMHPTLQGDNNFFKDDRILVNKWRYGPRIPFTTVRLWNWGGPKRWDIVVFKNVEEDSDHGILVKRVAALPGERVHIAGGTLFINGEAVEPPEDLADDLKHGERLNTAWKKVMREFVRFVAEDVPLGIYNPASTGVAELSEDVKKLRPQLRGIDVDALSFEEIEAYCAVVRKSSLSLILELLNAPFPEPEYGIREEDEFSMVPAGHYFLLGDNGPVSLDGRFFGWVPHNHLYGPAFAIWWPVGHWRDFSGFSQTWWGKLLLYGIPACLVALEVRHYRNERKRRRRERA